MSRPRSRLAIFCLALSSCGGQRLSTSTVDSRAPRELEMEPMVVEASGDPATPGDAFDDRTLFERGRDALDSLDFARADQAYQKLLEYFPESRLVPATLYNRGLCLEYLRMHGEAAAHFRRYAQLSTELREQRDGQFRWGYNLVKTKDWPAALSLYSALLEQPDLGHADKAEAYLRRGTAQLGLLQYGEAERDLKRAMQEVRMAYDGVTDGNDIFAEAHFRRGEIYQALFRKVKLKLPVEAMKEDLRDKVRFFRQALDSYLDSLNTRHTYWATAAGMRLGELYEEMYLSILQAEVPDDFDDDTKRFYFRELKQQLQPLVVQALTIYERNITMSERIGAENEWVEQTEQRLLRLRDLLETTERDATERDAAAGGAGGAGG